MSNAVVNKDDNTFYIPGNAGISLMGHLLKCTKCGRKIAMQVGLIGTVHHVQPSVTCGECLDIDQAFATQYPEVTEQLEEWKKSNS